MLPLSSGQKNKISLPPRKFANPSIYDATIPSGPWHPSDDDSILLRVPRICDVPLRTKSSHHVLGFSTGHRLRTLVLQFWGMVRRSKYWSQVLFLTARSSSVYQSSPRHLRGFLNINLFYGARLSSLRPNPQLRPGYPFSYGLSPSTCPEWQDLPAATLPPAELSGSFDQPSPTTTYQDTIGGKFANMPHYFSQYRQ